MDVWDKYHKSNRERLRNLLNPIKDAESPEGWSLVTCAAVGGLTDLGFSKTGPYLLMISGQGRGVFHCATGEKIARDYEAYGDWFDEGQLQCQGIGPIESEIIQTSGLHGGGLPRTNGHGDSVTLTALKWPQQDLYFCYNFGSPLIEKYAPQCCRLETVMELRAYGFSWCGNYLLSAVSSDFKLWKKK